MGGSAFTTGPEPLYTPRMPPAVYYAVKARCHALLREAYLIVATPIDGPAKTTFGDVDIFVACPKAQPPPKGRQEARAGIKAMLGAERMIETRANNSSSANLAVPWPEDLLEADAELQREGGGESEGESRRRFIQVDVRICDSLPKLEWILFTHAHGDIWSLLGSTIRQFGLTVDEEAMHVRVQEIEDADRKRARVRLTADPAEVLQFLGLPLEDYWSEPFQSVSDMFDYVAKCRFFWVGQKSRPAGPGEEGNGEVVAASDGGGGDLWYDRSRLKPSDLKRMKGRPVYRTWIEEYIPHCRRRGLHATKTATRDQITREALERFAVEAEFRACRDSFLFEQDRKTIWANAILHAVPKSEDPADDQIAVMYRTCLRKALKQIILEDDRSYSVGRGEGLVGDNGFFDLDKVRAWVRENQAAVGEEAMARSVAGRATARKGKPSAEAGEVLEGDKDKK